MAEEMGKFPSSVENTHVRGGMRKEEDSAPNSVLVSAIICTHNRERYLRLALNSLLGQSIPREKYEILVVDNASSNGTANVCREFSDQGVRYVYEPELGLSHARNRGYLEAKGQYVGYLDDDAVADVHWLEAAIHAFQTASPLPECVGGPVHLIWECPKPEWLCSEMCGSLGQLELGDYSGFLPPTQNLMGGNTFYRRSQLVTIGGFEVSLGLKGGKLMLGEETHLFFKIRQAGGRLYYDSRVSIQHHAPQDRLYPNWFYRRYYAAGISSALMDRLRESSSLREAEKLSPVACHASPHKLAGISRVKRFASKTMRALGFGSPAQRVLARANMCYSLGLHLARLGLVGKS